MDMNQPENTLRFGDFGLIYSGQSRVKVGSPNPRISPKTRDFSDTPVGSLFIITFEVNRHISPPIHGLA